MESDYAGRANSNYISNLGNAYTPIKIEIDSTKAITALYNSAINTLYFRSVNHFSNRTMLEEVIHSVQKVLYTSTEQFNARFNIEFEAKLIIDYISLSNNGRGDTDMANQMKDRKIMHIAYLNFECLDSINIIANNIFRNTSK